MTMVQRYADKAEIGDVTRDARTRRARCAISRKRTNCLSEIGFIGDDVIDLEAMGRVGLGSCAA